MSAPDAAAPPYWQVPSLDHRDRVIGGVAAGLGAEVGIDAVWVRLAFVALFTAGGWGALLYMVLWGVLAWHGYRRPTPVAGRVPKGRTPATRTVGVLFVVAGAFALFAQLVGLPWSVMGPTGLVGVGAVVAWQQLVPGRAPAARTRLDLAQIVGGVLVAILGAALLVRPAEQWTGLGFALPVGIVVGLGLVALSAPWWWRLLADLDAERQARIRSDERAEVAAHLHDSVLQTLSLIQRHGDEPQKMVSLARRQERELRNWLDADRADRSGASLRTKLDELASDVEELHGVPVEVVVVGDCVVDDAVLGLLAAAREAAVNAAKHSGAGRVDCYAEVGPGRLEVFVRDAGTGFDPGAIPVDRRGIRASIEGRMQRIGGSATIMSEPGEGTEVELRLPRNGSHADRAPSADREQDLP